MGFSRLLADSPPGGGKRSEGSGSKVRGNAARNGYVDAARRAATDGRLMVVRLLIPRAAPRASSGKGDRAHTVPHEDRRPLQLLRRPQFTALLCFATPLCHPRAGWSFAGD